MLFKNTLVLAAAAVFSAASAQVITPGPKPPVSSGCPCFTATQYIEFDGCPLIDPCPELPCVASTTTTIPGPNTRCPNTPTTTAFKPCKTSCEFCASTSTVTETASSSCLIRTFTLTNTATGPEPTAVPVEFAA